MSTVADSAGGMDTGRLRSAGPASRAAAARLVTLPVSAALAFLTARMVIGQFGIAAYGVFAFVLALPALLPAKDLGMGARVTDVVARRDVVGLGEVGDTLAAALAKMAKVATGAVAALLLVQVTVGWPTVLGGATEGLPEWAVTASLALFALSLPAALCTSVFWGLRRNDLLAFQAPLLTLGTCVGVVVAVALGWPVWAALLIGMGAGCAVQWLSLGVAVSLAGLSRTSLLAKAVSPVPTSFRSWALPMFVISTAAALGYQTDRLVLSHVAGATAVAHYSVAAQLFFPLWAVVSSAGYTLWAKYAVEREAGAVSPSSFVRTAARFAVAGALGGAFLVAVGPELVGALLNVDVARTVFAAFGLLLALQAAGLPVGMLLTDRAGLRLQAVCFAIMVVANVALSIMWARELGTSGPVLASAFTYGLLVLLPSVAFSRRYFRPPAEEPNFCVGIVVPTLGTRPEWLANAVASVERQEGAQLCIVAPLEALDGLRAQFPGRRIVAETENGIVAAIEAGWRALENCEVVSWLGDDDELTPDSVATALKCLQGRRGAAMVYGDYEMVDGDGRTFVRVRPGRWAPGFLRLGQNFIAQPGCLYSRSEIARTGGLSKSLRLAFDAALHLELGRRAVYCPATLAKVRIHEARLTTKEGRESSAELRSAVWDRTRMSRFLALLEPVWRGTGRIYYRLHRSYGYAEQ
jgi:O-antigen/teichoic acid export membrane protein